MRIATSYCAPNNSPVRARAYRARDIFFPPPPRCALPHRHPPARQAATGSAGPERKTEMDVQIVSETQQPIAKCEASLTPPLGSNFILPGRQIVWQVFQTSWIQRPVGDGEPAQLFAFAKPVPLPRDAVSWRSSVVRRRVEVGPPDMGDDLVYPLFFNINLTDGPFALAGRRALYVFAGTVQEDYPHLAAELYGMILSLEDAARYETPHPDHDASEPPGEEGT